MKLIFTYLTSFVLTMGCTSVPEERLNNFPEVVVPVSVFVQNRQVTAGSGIIIDCIPKGDVYSIAVLTAKHNTTNIPPNGKLYIGSHGVLYPCLSVYPHPSLDAAVIVFDSPERLTGAHMSKTAPVPLSAIYNCGYPLGFELTISTGILNYSIANHLGQKPNELWLCTAPTYPGNSGGGIFDKVSKKLIGLSIAVGSDPKHYGSVVVPHIHIFIPINVLIKWIDEVNYERQKV